MAGIPEITLARNGARVALVYPSYPLAHDEFEHLVELAPDASKVNASSGKLAIEFAGGGLIRFYAVAKLPRGLDFDQVIVHPDAWSEAAYAELAPAVATTGGVIRIAEGAVVIRCRSCHATLAVPTDGYTLEHHEDGSHTTHTPEPVR